MSNINGTHFFIGTLITVVTVITNISVTLYQTNNLQHNNQVTQMSTLFMQLSSAIDQLSGELDKQAGMYVDIEGCLTKNPKELKKCWINGSSLFDPDSSSQAWIKLKSQVGFSIPFLINKKEKDLLNILKNLDISHQKSIRALIPPKTKEKAFEVSNAILQSKQILLDAKKSLFDALSERISN